MAKASAKGRPAGPGDHVFLVDGSSFVFRAYFQSINQDAKYNYRSDGLPTGAVRLFVDQALPVHREGAVGIKPTHLAIVFDKSEQTFRKEIYADYKAHPARAAGRPRAAVPADARRRCAPSASSRSRRRATRPTTSSPPMPTQARDAGADVLIISSDKDLMQLVSDKVAFYDFESGAKGKPGYRPERKIDRAGRHRLFRRAAREGDRRPGAGRRHLRQRPRRARHRHQDRVAAHHRISATSKRCSPRAGEIKQPKRRELLTDLCRAGAPVEAAGDARHRHVALETCRSPALAVPRARSAPRSSPSSRRWSSRR